MMARESNLLNVATVHQAHLPANYYHDLLTSDNGGLT